MKELLLQLAGYHYWANQQLTDVIQQLPEEKKSQMVPSSFNSLLKTALHMWDAESIWWQRIKLSERIMVPSENFTGTFKEVANQLLLQNKQWIEWISNAQEHMFQHEFIYLNSKK